jgi:hypothetical protein
MNATWSAPTAGEDGNGHPTHQSAPPKSLHLATRQAAGRNDTARMQIQAGSVAIEKPRAPDFNDVFLSSGIGRPHDYGSLRSFL